METTETIEARYKLRAFRLSTTGFSPFPAQGTGGWSPQEAKLIPASVRVRSKNSSSSSFRYDVKRWLMSFGCDAELLGPEELRNEIQQEVREMAQVYEK